jgi:hypothetical protein
MIPTLTFLYSMHDDGVERLDSVGPINRLMNAQNWEHMHFRIITEVRIQ